MKLTRRIKEQTGRALKRERRRLGQAVLRDLRTAAGGIYASDRPTTPAAKLVLFEDGPYYFKPQAN